MWRVPTEFISFKKVSTISKKSPFYSNIIIIHPLPILISYMQNYVLQLFFKHYYIFVYIFLKKIFPKFVSLNLAKKHIIQLFSLMYTKVEII